MNDRNEILIPCVNCRSRTSHGVLGTHKNDEHDTDSGISVWNEYFIVQCLGCKAVSFVHESSCSEDYEMDPESGNSEIAVRTRLYPSRLEGRQPIQRGVYIPDLVEAVYLETFRALVEKMPILAGIGIRAIIETISKEKNAAGGNLEKKIDALVQMGLITADGAEILHSLRFLGNAAAHETKAHSEEELEIALDVVEHLLNTVYILPKMAKKLPSKQKRDSQGNPAK